MKRVAVVFVFVFLMTGVLAIEEGEFYTENFYIFLGLVGLGIVVIGLFVWLWIRGPVNKWKKK